MDLNDYSALFAQLGSAPGLQQRFQRNAAMNEGFGIVNRNTQNAGTRNSQFNISPDLMPELVNNSAQAVNALPYQTGSAPGAVWPGDPNWNGMIQPDPMIQQAVLSYLKSQMGPSFQLPSAPPLQ